MVGGQTEDRTTWGMAGNVGGTRILVSLTRLDGSHFVLNTDLIEFMEATPDTVITLTNGHHFVVRERVEEVVRQIILFRHCVHVGRGVHGEDR